MKPITRTILSTIFSFVLLLSISSNSTADVGPDGSFNYSIPIELPQGTAGMAPSLALVYNSNSGNGMLGMGWDLAGPGGRLVLIASGAFAGDYHYENESFSRIEPYGAQGDGPSYWIETKPAPSPFVREEGEKKYLPLAKREMADLS